MRLTGTSGTIERGLVAACNAFGFGLLRHLSGPGEPGNAFISPPSVALVLAMAYNGASGATQRAMADTLGLEGLSLEEVNERFLALRAALTNPDPDVRLAIANSLWARQGVAYRPEFLERTVQSYGAEVERLNFGDPAAPSAINRWVEINTQGKIDRIVEQLDPAEVLVLVNAIYFKGAWTWPFDEARTEQGVFTLADGREQRRRMMHQVAEYPYYEDPEVQGVRIPYGATMAMSMYVILPRRPAALGALRERLAGGGWEAMASGFRRGKGELVLPRFRLEHGAELVRPLAALGMGAAFGPTADFGGICDGSAWIDRVAHKTFVEVNEQGTEAAAVSMASILRSAPQPFQMTVDRPFFCAIRDDRTGLVLFMGFVAEPD